MSMSTADGEELTRLSARALAARITSGDVSAVEAVEAHIARIEAVKPRLNPAVVKRYAPAPEEARAPHQRPAPPQPLPPPPRVPGHLKEFLRPPGIPPTLGFPWSTD